MKLCASPVIVYWPWIIRLTISSPLVLVVPVFTSFVLTAVGLGIVIVGVDVVSNVWKTPTYNMILAWDPEAPPADWLQLRDICWRWHFLRFSAGTVGLCLLIGAALRLVATVKVDMSTVAGGQ